MKSLLLATAAIVSALFVGVILSSVYIAWSAMIADAIR